MSLVVDRLITPTGRLIASHSASASAASFSAQLLAQNRLFGGIHSVKLKNVFRRIHANSANLFHGRPPLSEIYSDLILARLMPSGAVHTNRKPAIRLFGPLPPRRSAALDPADGCPADVAFHADFHAAPRSQPPAAPATTANSLCLPSPPSVRCTRDPPAATPWRSSRLRRALLLKRDANLALALPL
jgi:hypothetical protein